MVTKNEVRFTVPGEPVGKGRPRLSSRNGFAHAYTPAGTRKYEAMVRKLAGEEMERQLRTRIPQTAIGGKPQRSRNRQINANPSDFALFGVLRFRVGLYVPGGVCREYANPCASGGH